MLVVLSQQSPSQAQSTAFQVTAPSEAGPRSSKPWKERLPSTDWMWRARLGAWALLPDSPRMYPSAFGLSDGAPGPPGQEDCMPPPHPQCTSAPRLAKPFGSGGAPLPFSTWVRGTQGSSRAPTAGKGLESRDCVPTSPSQVWEQEVRLQGRVYLCSERGGWGLALE